MVEIIKPKCSQCGGEDFIGGVDTLALPGYEDIETPDKQTKSGIPTGRLMAVKAMWCTQCDHVILFRVP